MSKTLRIQDLDDPALIYPGRYVYYSAKNSVIALENLYTDFCHATQLF